MIWLTHKGNDVKTTSPPPAPKVAGYANPQS